MKTFASFALVVVAALALGCVKKAAPANNAPAAATAMPECCKMENGAHTCQHGDGGQCCAAHASK